MNPRTLQKQNARLLRRRRADELFMTPAPIAPAPAVPVKTISDVSAPGPAPTPAPAPATLEYTQAQIAIQRLFKNAGAEINLLFRRAKMKSMLEGLRGEVTQ
jgi:hypothetical protein